MMKQNTKFNQPETKYPTGDDDGEIDDEGKRYVKYRVSGVTVTKIAERVQYYDADGKLVTESFKDYTRNTIKKQFASLNDFHQSLAMQPSVSKPLSKSWRQKVLSGKP